MLLRKSNIKRKDCVVRVGVMMVTTTIIGHNMVQRRSSLTLDMMGLKVMTLLKVRLIGVKDKPMADMALSKIINSDEWQSMFYGYTELHDQYGDWIGIKLD